MLDRTSKFEVSDTKRKLLDAGMELMRAHGYNATTVDHICAAAGVTKGGFFHYFKSKDEIAKAALAHFAAGKVKDYEEAPFRKLIDPLDRVFGRLDYVEKASGASGHHTKGCLIGVFAQEMAFNNPELREACQGYFSKIGEDFSRDLAEAKAAYAPNAKFDPKKLALFYVSIVQGSLMLAKTAGNNQVFRENIEQLREHLELLFGVERRAAGTLATQSTHEISS